MSKKIILIIFIFICLSDLLAQDIFGRIQLINENIIKINKGSNNGIFINNQVIITRNDDLKGLAIVIEVENEDCIAKVIKNESNINIGDMAEFFNKYYIDWEILKSNYQINNDPIGKVSIAYHSIELFKNCEFDQYSYELRNKTDRILNIGETVDLIDVIPNDSESRFFYKIRTKNGDIGYIKPGIKIIEPYNERGRILFIDISEPYEFECNIQEVNSMIDKYKKFNLKYPNSVYTFYALRKLVFLNLYPIQCEQAINEKISRLNIIDKLYNEMISKYVEKDSRERIMTEYICLMKEIKRNLSNNRTTEPFSIFSEINNSILKNIDLQQCRSPYGKYRIFNDFISF